MGREVCLPRGGLGVDRDFAELAGLAGLFLLAWTGAGFRTPSSELSSLPADDRRAGLAVASQAARKVLVFPMARLGLEAIALFACFLDGLGVGIRDESRRLSVKKSSLAGFFRKG